MACLRAVVLPVSETPQLLLLSRRTSGRQDRREFMAAVRLPPVTLIARLTTLTERFPCLRSTVGCPPGPFTGERTRYRVVSLRDGMPAGTRVDRTGWQDGNRTLSSTDPNGHAFREDI